LVVDDAAGQHHGLASAAVAGDKLGLRRLIHPAPRHHRQDALQRADLTGAEVGLEVVAGDITGLDWLITPAIRIGTPIAWRAATEYGRASAVPGLVVVAVW
jgi:hypothetical protein